MRLPLLLLILSSAGQVHAQPVATPPTPPACVAARAGIVACLGDRLCECRFDPGGSLAGRPAGHRWDCGVLRPACGTVPPDLGQPLTTLRDLPPIMLAPAGPDPRDREGSMRGGQPWP